MIISFIYWNPSRIFFSIPLCNISVTFYGFLFASGFILSANLFFYILKQSLRQNVVQVSENDLSKFFDKIFCCLALSIVVGARIGHVLFYDLPFYREYPFRIFKIWEGGLSSYGGIIFVFLCFYGLAAYYRKRFTTLSFFLFTDIASIVFGIFASLIRIGNFFNQEVVGITTRMPWGVYFGSSPYSLKSGPLHPVQLYESLFYLLIFANLFFFHKKNKITLGSGLITAITCIIVASGRFILEYYKENTSMLLSETFLLTMGQILSIPLFISGIFLLLKKIKV